jgi:hypothetical protein
MGQCPASVQAKGRHTARRMGRTLRPGVSSLHSKARPIDLGETRGFNFARQHDRSGPAEVAQQKKSRALVPSLGVTVAVIWEQR